MGEGGGGKISFKDFLTPIENVSTPNVGCKKTRKTKKDKRKNKRDAFCSLRLMISICYINSISDLKKITQIIHTKTRLIVHQFLNK